MILRDERVFSKRSFRFRAGGREKRSRRESRLSDFFIYGEEKLIVRATLLFLRAFRVFRAALFLNERFVEAPLNQLKLTMQD